MVSDGELSDREWILDLHTLQRWYIRHLSTVAWKTWEERKLTRLINELVDANAAVVCIM
jgi:hypothetical protein